MLRRKRMAMVDSRLSKMAEKLSVVLIQEPGLLAGMEEDVNSIHARIHRWAANHRAFTSGFMEPLRDISYDVEDFIDDLTLKAAGTGSSSSGLREKLENIMVKVDDVSRRGIPCAMIRTETVKDQNIAQTVVSPVIKNVTDLLAESSLRPQVKKKARRMEDEFKLINVFLEKLESVELDNEGMAWLEELCNISSDSVGVINLFINNRRLYHLEGRQTTFGGVVTAFNKMSSQLRLGVEMDQIYARLQDLGERMPQQVFDNGQQHFPPEGIRIHSSSTTADSYINHVKEPNVAAFDDDVQEIVSRLLITDDKSFSAISIVGMKGLGKTTLVKFVFDNVAVVHHFPYRASASFDQTDRGFLKDVLKQMDRNKCIPTLWKEEHNIYKSFKEEKEELWSLLNSFLKDKKYLIVVDDIYSTHILEVLRRFPDTSNGSRMILITQHGSILSDLPMKALHLTLQLRDDNESWALFKHLLNITIPPELLISLRGDILKTCCGLPLIIKKLADALSQKDTTIEEWSGVLQQLNGDQEFRSLILYDINTSLPLHMKRCLFYFGLFPQNIEIPTRRLIALWIAEGLVYSEDEIESTPEDVAKKYLTKLIGQSMVQVTKKKVNGDVQACRLPDPIRRQWYLKAREATFLQLQTSTTSSEISLGTGMVRRLVDHLDVADSSFTHIHGHDHNTSTKSIPLKAYYEATSSFISFDTRNGISLPGDDITSFLGRCISSGCFLLLRVLDLERVYKPNLPVEVGRLTLLRFLGLRWTSLKILPSSISKLLNLLTLDLKYTDITTLPSEIWKLQQLRHLYLSERDWSKFTHQPSAGSLTALQTLWGLFIDEKTPVKDGLDRLLNLRKLALKFRLTPSQQEAMVSQLEAVADWVLKLNHLQSLRLTSSDDDDQPWDLDLKSLSNHVKLSTVYLVGRLKNPSVISEFPNSLTVLTLSGSGLAEDPMRKLDKLPNLRVLMLRRRSYIGKHMLCSSGGFPQLRVLKLWWLEQLEEWNVEEGALGALRELEIRSCLLLRMLPEGLRHRAFLGIEVN